MWKTIKLNKVPLLIFCVILLMNPPSLFWGTGKVIAYSIVIILLIILRYRIHRSLIQILPILGLVALIMLLLPIIRGFHGSSILILLTYPIAFVINKEEGKKVINYLTTILAWILIVSLPLWLFHVFVHQLPLIRTLDLTEMKGSETLMNDYLFFVTNNGVEYFRFYSVFDEPGVLGTLSAIILYANNYKFRNWRVLIIFFASLFTYSMAFYVITIIGVLYSSIRNRKIIKLIMFMIVPLLLIGYGYMKDDYAFKNAVVNRFTKYDSVDLLDNRTGDHENIVFDNMIKSSDSLFGFGDTYLQKMKLTEGQSYKRFLLEYGLIGVIVMILMYLSLCRRKFNFYTIGFIFIFSLSFLQRPLIWTSWQILLFACIIQNLLINTNKVKVRTYGLERQIA